MDTNWLIVKKLDFFMVCRKLINNVVDSGKMW